MTLLSRWSNVKLLRELINEDSIVDKPEFVTSEHLEYLDDLRESGVTNMFVAGAYLERSFDIDKHTAGQILQYWMDTFSERHSD